MDARAHEAYLALARGERHGAQVALALAWAGAVASLERHVPPRLAAYIMTFVR